MKTFKEFLQLNEKTLVDRFELFAGVTLKAGRNTIKGYPVDIDDSSDGTYLEMDAVDSDAASDLAKELKKAGFKVKRVGKVGLLVESDISEAVTINEKDRVVIKSGSSAMYVEKTSKGISIGVKKAMIM